MLFHKITILIFASISFIFAQQEMILPAQKNAIQLLSKENGFSDSDLNTYLYSEYRKDLSELSKDQAISIIQQFQGSNPPQPIKYEPALADILEVGMSKQFYLQDGNIIKGAIMAIEDNKCHIQTAEGLLKIPMNEILEETVDLIKHDDARYKGPLLQETNEFLIIRSNYGDVTVYKKDIKKMDRFHGGKFIPWVENKKNFTQGSEELITIHLDEKAFVLDPNTFYLSAMSIGYGFTDRFMIKTQFGPNFNGDLNLHPKMRFWHKKTAEREQALAWGIKLHRAYSEKKIISDFSHAWTVGLDSDSVLNKIGWTTTDLDRYDLNKRFLCEFYLVYSSQRKNPSGRGKVGWSVGAKSSNKVLLANELEKNIELEFNHKNLEKYWIPLRLWANFDYDLRKNLKFVGSMWIDNTHRSANLDEVLEDYFGNVGESFAFDDLGGDHTLVDFDFGFLYAVNENLRLGLHFQKPYFDIYWKFLEF